MKFDVSGLKKTTEIGEYLKKNLARICYNALCAEIGEEYARYIELEINAMPDEDTSVPFKKNSVVVECADTTDKDGFTVGIIGQIDVTIKSYNPRYTKKDNITHSAVTLTDIDDALENAREVAKIKEQRNAEKAKEKERKIEADKARRAKREEKG